VLVHIKPSTGSRRESTSVSVLVIAVSAPRIRYSSSVRCEIRTTFFVTSFFPLDIHATPDHPQTEEGLETIQIWNSGGGAIHPMDRKKHPENQRLEESAAF
jgi:hypothetical protein